MVALSRSQQMARIRGSETAPELNLRRALRMGQVDVRIGRIRPDIVLSKKAVRVAVFVDGCFWHGCPEHYVCPRSSVDFWSRKLRENTARDTRQTLQLRADGWVIVRLWEHEVREDVNRAAAKVRTALSMGRSRVERWHVVEVTADVGLGEQRLLRKLLHPEYWRIEESARSTAKVGRVGRHLVAQGTGGL